MPILKERLKHPNRYVAVCAALALYHIEESQEGLAVASAAWHDPNYRVRIVATETLWRLQPQDVTPLLMERLREIQFQSGPSTANERYMIARLLGRIGPRAKPAVELLTGLLAEDEVQLRLTAAWALKQIDPEAARKAGVQ